MTGEKHTLENSSTIDKLEQLRAILRNLERVAVAFSGGVDSAFLLKVAVDTLGPTNVVAVTAMSPSLPERDLGEARSLVRSLGVEQVTIDAGEFADPSYLRNHPDRCYHCKSALYGSIQPLLAERGLRAVLSGTNADDLGDYRPGLIAAKEHGVREPCAEVGLTKAEIRRLSAELGLPTSDKPASPCLSSRVPYGEPITAWKLNMIERAEIFLWDTFGIGECRVRFHEGPTPTRDRGDRVDPGSTAVAGQSLARIEVPPQWIDVLAQEPNRSKVEAAFRAIGFMYVTLDLRGFRSGSLNEALRLNS